HREEACAPAQRVFEVRLQPPAEQLHVGQYAVVHRNVEVVGDGLQVGGDRLLDFYRGRLECGDREDVVQGGTVVFLFRESVTLRERRGFLGADLLDQPVKMLTDARLEAGTVRRLEEHFESAV